MCKNGIKCKNHDWDIRSPIVKVCTKGPHCDNHDWKSVDKQDSPFQVVCKRGPSCEKHDWDHRSPMHSKLMQRSKRTRIINGSQSNKEEVSPDPKLLMDFQERLFTVQMEQMR